MSLKGAGGKTLLPGSVLGILGGGQLGRMFAMAAKRLGYRVAVLEPAPDSPCGQVADIVIQADYTDEAALRRLAAVSDAVTYEFENVDARAVEFLESLGKPVHPSSSALRITQDRILEKTFARENGIPVTPFASVRSADEARAVFHGEAFPGFLKTARGGYDGKGQARVGNGEEAARAWADFKGHDLILEKLVPFEKEISVVACRGRDGSFAAYPPAENAHVRNILDVSVLPARVSAASAAAAVKIARQVGEGLSIVGTFCVELFVLPDGEIWLNEIAPRPHNSGHATLDACLCSQFEQQVRALCGLPLGSTALLRPAAMVNLVGDGGGDRLAGVDVLLADPEAALHLYGKKHAPRGRKMGHFTVLGETADAAEAKARALRSNLKWEA
ncbi:MAG: 5-(carboxyamino)imidazole ribonucleotide synthase [Fibrobacteria bacterium]|jgi:5-(carboxyamino)imidazole ribonucleotide synthase|nr:5-(carboxyamino)imidazole ribonucleotide synthase [Fibrobacteria bacterium]